MTGQTVSVRASNDTSAAYGAMWEEGIYTYTTGTPNTLVRTTILDSSNAGAAVDFSGSADPVVLEMSLAASTMELLTNPGATMVATNGSTVQSITNSTFTKLAACLTTVIRNPFSWWDTTNKKFLPTKSGVYWVGLGVGVTNMDAGASLIAMIYKNGSVHKMVTRGYAGSVASVVVMVSGGTLVELNGTSDYVEFYCWQNSAAARDTSIEAERVHFAAFRVSDL